MSAQASRPKVVMCINAAWNVANFRGGLIQGLQDAGYEVIALAPPDEAVPRVEAMCRYVPLHMDKQGTRPDRDLATWWRVLMVLRRERPAVYLGYTVKPNVYGSLAAHALGIPVINNIAGLGAVFIQNGWLVKLVRHLYTLALGRSSKVFFQNDDDRELFLSHGMVKLDRTALLPGSGIDLQRFAPAPWPAASANAPVRFLLIARMLWDKGVGEYVEAARLVRAVHPGVEFALLGFVDVENPAAISRAQMDAWVAEGHVRYLGTTTDVRPDIAASDCVVLPSYREGTPRTLLEAAAMARPIITTDAVGCREVVDHERNGYLCRVRDAQSLADAMLRFLSLTPAQRRAMGDQGREKMVAQFDEQLVVRAYLDAIQHAVA